MKVEGKLGTAGEWNHQVANSMANPQLFFGWIPLTNAKLGNMISRYNRKGNTQFIPMASCNRGATFCLPHKTKKCAIVTFI